MRITAAVIERATGTTLWFSRFLKALIDPQLNGVECSGCKARRGSPETSWRHRGTFCPWQVFESSLRRAAARARWIGFPESPGPVLRRAYKNAERSEFPRRVCSLRGNRGEVTLLSHRRR